MRREVLIWTQVAVVIVVVVMLVPTLGQAGPSKPAGNIDGYVTDSSTGAGILEATVTAVNTLGATKVATTDGSGYYLLTRLGTAGNPWTLTVTKAGYYSQTRSVTVIASTTIRENFALVLTPPVGNVTGYVYGSPSMQPIVGAHVYLDGTQYAGDSRSPDGFFEIPQVIPGTYVLKATKDRYYVYTHPSLVTVVSNQRTHVGDIYMTMIIRTLPSARTGAAAAWASSQGIAVISGGNTVNGRLSEVVEYNPSTDTCTAVNALSAALCYASSVSDGRYVYIIGGQTSNTAGTKTISTYDPVTNTATHNTKGLATATWGTSAVWTGTYGYIFGGEYYKNGFKYSTNILRFSASSTTTVTMAAKLPTGMAFTSAVYDGQRYVYIFGGFCGVDASEVYENEILRYDTTTDTISTLSTLLPYRTAYGAAVWTGQKALILGGWVSPGGVSTVLQFDPAAGTAGEVITLLRSLPEIRHAHSAVWDGYTTWLFGGTVSGASDDIIRYHYFGARDLGVDPYSIFVGGMVNVANGNLVIRETDISMSARGFEISFVRTYNSMMSTTDGPLGPGWTHTYNVKLETKTYGDMLLTEACGSQHLFMKEPDGSFVMPPGVSYRLTSDYQTGGYVLWSLDGSRMKFDSLGKLTSQIDKNGNKLNFVYSSGKLINVTDDSGMYLKITYNAGNRIESVSDPNGDTAYFTYSNNAPILGCLIHKSYKFSGQLTQPQVLMEYNDNTKTMKEIRYYVIDRYLPPPIGYVTMIMDKTSFVYDASGRVSEVWKAEVAEILPNEPLYPAVKKYDIDYLTTTSTLATCALGGTMSVTMLAEGLPSYITGSPIAGTPSEKGCGGGGCSGSNLYPGRAGNEALLLEWTSDFNIQREYDGNGNWVQFTYDSFDNAIQVADIGAGVSTYEYKVVVSPTQFISLLMNATDPMGNRTEYIYDSKGNMVFQFDPLRYYVQNWYDQYGNVNKTRDKRGYITQYVINPKGEVTQIVSPQGASTNYSYNLTGETESITTPMGYVTEYGYFNTGETKNISHSYPVGSITEYEISHQGEQIKITDAAGHVTLYDLNVTLRSYDSVTDALTKTTHYYYDAMGHLIKVTDANGNSYTFAYDSYARLKSVTYPLGQKVEMTYDHAGNLISRKDPNGVLTTYTYDNMNRLDQTIYPNGDIIDREYDKVGNLRYITAPGFWERTSYDELGRVKTVTTNNTFLDHFDDPVSYQVSETLTYDANGNVLTDSFSDSTGFAPSIRYSYDSMNRVIRVYRSVQTYAGYFWFDYDNDGRRTYQEVAEAKPAPVYDIEYVYDPAGNLLYQNFTSTGAWAPGNYRYEYDILSRLTKAVDWTGTIRYSYDNLGQLLSYSKNGTVQASYTYDSVGNRKTETSGGVTVTYNYDANDRLLSTSDGVTYGYDNNGNMVYKSTGWWGSTTYSYDYENRMTYVYDSGNGYIGRYNYSPDGNLLVQAHRQRSGWFPSVFAYSHAQSLPTVAMRLDQLNGIHDIFYTGPNTDEFLGMFYGNLGNDWIAFVDGLGNTRCLADAEVDRFTVPENYVQIYTPFGEMSYLPLYYWYEDLWLIAPSYQGRVFDAVSGLYNFRARNYDPGTGRFAQLDPEQTYGLSGYAFVMNSPLTGRDPTGMLTQQCAIAWIFFTLSLILVILGVPMAQSLFGKFTSWLIKAGGLINKAYNLLNCAKSKDWICVLKVSIGIAKDYMFKFYIKSLSFFKRVTAAIVMTARFLLIWASVIWFTYTLIAGLISLRQQGCL